MMFCTVSASCLVKGCNTFASVLRTTVVYSCLERCPYLERRRCLERAPFGVGFGPSVPVIVGCRFVFFVCDCRVDSRLVTIADRLTHPVPVPLWVSLMEALLVSQMYHQGLERKP